MYLPQWSISPYCVKNNGFCTFSQENPYLRNFDGKSQIAQFYWLRIVSPVFLSSILCCFTFVGSVSHFYHNWINAANFVTLQSKVSVLNGNPGPLGTYLMTFTSQIYSYILLPTICKIISSLSAVMDEEKDFFSWPNRDFIFGTLRFCLKGSIGLN